jgi:predicted transcriptional regulator of viral defense system
MADSVNISSNLTRLQLDFVHLMDEHEIDIFSFAGIELQLGKKFENLNEILENLVDKNILVRIEKGKFCRANFSDENVIGCFLASDGAISYWSALNKHGLTEQFPNNLYIQTTKNKQVKNILGINYKFVRVPARKITGINTEGFGSRKYRITDIEKTIVDCFDLPEHSGGYAELIRAFGQAKLNSDKLIEYCTAIDNIAATKRMGFLAEFLDKKGMSAFIKYAINKVNSKYNLIDPFGSEKGEFEKNWRLRLNITRDEITDICNKQY